MKARVKWIEGTRYLGTSGSGHGVVMEASAADQSIGPSPMEMLLIGMGGCTTYDVVAILQKMRLDVDDVTVDLEAERADSIPKIFTKIHCIFTVYGTNIPLAKAEEAVRLSGEKYCSASRMLEKSAVITFETKVVGAQTD
ncbi:MAG: OsmC family protein [Rhodospirillales bacterium]|nr:OsmC family protein [Rhodospirillales bacterium]